MNTETKKLIVKAATQYIADYNLSQNELSRKSGVNQGYLSMMLKGNFITNVSDKETPIGDKWFHQLASTIGFSTSKMYWETFPTVQFMQVIDTLSNCKKDGKAAMVIGSTGFGKTYAVDVFVKKNPSNTFRITVSSLYKLKDIINELSDMLGVDEVVSTKGKVDKITQRLIEIKYSGGQPIIIIDEGENMKLPVLHMVKALYDALKDTCSIVIIGTEELLNKLLKMRRKNRDGIAQLFRRFKAGCVNISPVNKDFKMIFDKYVEDKGLRKLLTDLCDNYGELNDYLQPALKAADLQNVELSEDFFRLMYNLPKYK
jgi:DNA transposition AAA+ family ATPase